MHVVKPDVVRMSLADTITVKAARSGIPTSHRGDSDRDLIVNRDWGRTGVPGILSMCSGMLERRP